mgnify:CR=1 FL=1
MIEQVIFSNLVFNEPFGRKVLPFLKENYFLNSSDQIIYKLISNYVNEYNKFPSIEALAIELSYLDNLSEQQFEGSKDILEKLAWDEKTDLDWVVDQAEKFCKSKAIYNAIHESIKLLEDETGRNSIPQLMQDALAVSFESDIGHDYLENAMLRHEYYQLKEHKLPFSIDLLNKITSGGVSRKTLNIIMGGTGVGKSLLMGFFAAMHLMAGEKVLYITGEMSEEKISERIDAHLLDIPVNVVKDTARDVFETKIGKIAKKTSGKLIIKEYPTSTANVNHFRHELNELRIKKNFVPTIIYIDYLNIFSSSRISRSKASSYDYIKSIAEEFRGLAVEFNVPIISATQVNREGFRASDFGLEHTSESFGLPATADLFVGIIQSEALKERNQIMFMQLKNRYNNIDYYNKFVVGIDKSKMRLYDCEQSAQDEVPEDDNPVMDRTRSGDRMSAERREHKNKVFEDFN